MSPVVVPLSAPAAGVLHTPVNKRQTCLTAIHALITALSAQDIEAALTALSSCDLVTEIDAERQLYVHRGLIGLGAGLVAVPHLQPKLVTTIVEGLSLLGNRVAAETLARTEAQLGLTDRVRTLPALLNQLWTLGCSDVLAGFIVAQLALPTRWQPAVRSGSSPSVRQECKQTDQKWRRRFANQALRIIPTRVLILPEPDPRAAAWARRYVSEHLPGLNDILQGAVLPEARVPSENASLLNQLPEAAPPLAPLRLETTLLEKETERATNLNRLARVRSLIRQGDPPAVLEVVTELLQAQTSDLAGRLILRRALTTLQDTGGRLVLAASLLWYPGEASTPLGLLAKTTSDRQCAAELRRLARWRHPEQAVRRAITLLLNSDDADLKMGARLAWAFSLGKEMPSPTLTVAYVNNRVPGLLELLHAAGD